MSLDHSYRLTSHLKKFPKGFPGGVWKLKSEKFTYYLEQFVPDVCALKLKEQNQTEAEFHQPGVTLQMKQKAKTCPEIKNQVARVPSQGGKVMPRNQKPNGINVNCDVPVRLDL